MRARSLDWGSMQSHCVILTAFLSEFSFLKNTLGVTGLRVHRAETLEELDFLLIATDATVLLADTVTPTCTWRCAADLIRDRHPHVAMLLLAERVDWPYLQDLFQRGACGIIWKPVEFDVATDLIRTAHQAALDRLLLKEDLKPKPDAVVK